MQLIKKTTIVLFLALFPVAAHADREGFFRPNQQFIPIGSGRYYAVLDQVILPAEVLRVKEVAKDVRENYIQHLNRHRYWESGSPPEKDAVRRYLEREKAEEVRKKGG